MVVGRRIRRLLTAIQVQTGNRDRKGLRVVVVAGIPLHRLLRPPGLSKVVPVVVLGLRPHLAEVPELPRRPAVQHKARVLRRRLLVQAEELPLVAELLPVQAEELLLVAKLLLVAELLPLVLRPVQLVSPRARH